MAIEGFAINTIFVKGPPLGFRVAMLLLASIVLMTLDHKFGQLEKVRSSLSVVVYPAQFLVNFPIQAGAWLHETFTGRQVLIEENSRLRDQNLMLKSRTQKYAALESENMRLRELLDSSVNAGEKFLVADVVAVQLEPSMRQVVLNKGSQQGVYLGQPIIDAEGILGQVVHVGPVSCVGMLITDTSHAIPVQINRNGLRAVATGTGAGDALELTFVPVNSDVREGDLLVSSGMDGRFPAGYPVGQVKGVAAEPGELFVKVSVVASARFNTAREVLLVWPPDATADSGGANGSGTMVAR